MHDNITYIGQGAFSGCSSLASIKISNNVIKIMYNTFKGCSSLTSISLPNNITEIDGRDSEGCSSLSLIDASNCDNLNQIRSYSFNDCPINQFLLGATTPPAIGDQTFSHSDVAVLKVPAKSIDAYKNSDWAVYFKNIETL